MKPPGSLAVLASAVCILAVSSASSHAGITMDMVFVGNAGNPADQAFGGFGPFGSVAYDYAIGKYEVTNSQYAAFLNAVAAVEDTYSLYPATDNPSQPGNPKNILHPLTRGIVQSPSAGGFTYSVAPNMADKPANFLTWFSAARFANWMANGQPDGLQTAATTENGAYALNGAMGGNFTLTRNVVNPNTSAAPVYWMPSEDEWYKAAFYQPESLGGPSGGYWLYPTQSNADPAVASADAFGNIANPGANVANYLSGSTWNGQFENLTTVGSAGALSASFYGTYDQAGNVWEWSEGIVKNNTARGLRQGSANDPSALYLAASFADNGRPPDNYFWNAGIRLAAIPEPSAALLALMALGFVALGRRAFPGRRRYFFLAPAFLLASGNLLRADSPASLPEAIRAAARGDADWLRQWIAKGGNPDETGPDGWTPLLVASARGKAAAVDALLNNPVRKADPGIRFAPSGALPIHMAGQSGDVATAKLLLAARPADINEVWLLNGHTLLLQAAFYGHVEMAEFAIAQGADPAATTLRGLTAIDFARQFDNRPLVEALSPSAPSPDARAARYKALLERIREPVPPAEEVAQSRSDAAATAIADALKQAGDAPKKADDLLAAVMAKLDGVDPNRLAGDLRQPLLVVTVTGNNSGSHPEAAAALRLRIARELLDRGANPLAKEKHPMGAHAIIRASVFGHLEILKLIGTRLTAAQLADALNEIPPVNGLTGLHDAVLRAGTTSEDRLPGYLDQIRWEVGSGARSDIEDFSGRTQRQYAGDIADPARRQTILSALDSALPTPQWNHPAIAVPSLEPAVQWYSDVFGFMPLSPPVVHTPAIGERWKVATSIFGDKITEVRFLRMRAPGAPLKQVVEIFEVHPAPPPREAGKRQSGYVHACMIVGDPDTTAGRIAARGGKILSRATMNGLTIVFCEDPFGNIIELASGPW